MVSYSTSLSPLIEHALITVADDLTAGAAFDLARRHNVHHLPVLRSGVLVGLVCTCNLEAAPPDARVEALMSQPAVTLDRDATLSDAARAMNAHDVGSVILLNGDQPFGIITRGDLLRVEPALEHQLIKSRCECCGLTRHLQTGADGHTYCMFCVEPGADGRLSHFTAE